MSQVCAWGGCFRPVGEIDTKRGTGIIMAWQLSINAELVTRILRLTQVSIRSSATTNVGTKTTRPDVAKRHQLTKAITQAIQLYISGFINTLVNLWNANNVAKPHKTTDTFSGQTYQAHTDVNVATGLGFVSGVILNEIRHQFNISVDVIRKRYAKFTNNNELPDNWAELTPAIDGV